MTLSFDKQKVIDVALAEEGYLEKKSNDNLDSKTENAGYNNFTKYARDLDEITGFYNGKKNGFAWCDVFVDWCFVQAYGVEGAKKLLCQPSYSAGAGCTYSAQYYKNNNQFHIDDPEVGDQIFFGNATESTHTGIVYKVDESKVYTIEGNTSSTYGVIPNGGCVCKKSYPKTYISIYGYGRPAYSDDETEEPEEKEQAYSTAVLPVLEYGTKGTSVELLQYALMRKGFLPSNSRMTNGLFDGEFGNGTETALKAFQKAKGIALTEYGKTGHETWSKLFEI